MINNQQYWLALAIGNSQLHWGYFKQDCLLKNWDTPHLSIAVAVDKLPEALIIDRSLSQLPVYLASVVPEQTKLWQNYRQLNLITLKNIQLTKLYFTLGIDRALTVWSAVETYNLPCLVIDGGTALTFTAVDRERQLVGGAILPGLRSQFMNLKQKTAALPNVNIPNSLPNRWALNTDDAIASGIIYSAIAGINSYILDWQKIFPNSQVIFTGGDGKLLFKYLQFQYANTAKQALFKSTLILDGIKLARSSLSNTSNTSIKNNLI